MKKTGIYIKTASRLRLFTSALISTLHKRQDGSVIVIVAICAAVLIAILAFVLDLGLQYIETSKIQNAVDSTVLAAARELPAESTASQSWYNAVNQAVKYAALNGINDTSELTIDPVYQAGDSGRITGVTATATAHIHYHFAQIFGIGSGSVSRSASAGLKTVNKMNGLVPLCITQGSMSSIAPGVVKTLKYASNQQGIDFYNTSGWFGIVQLDGNGAPYYRDNFINGCSKYFSVGDTLDMQTGNLSGPTSQAFGDRIGSHSACTYDNHEPDCRRIVTLPVVTILPSKQVQIEGFARFFLVDANGSGNDSYIDAVYMGDTVLPGTVYDGAAGDFGLYVAKLTK